MMVLRERATIPIQFILFYILMAIADHSLNSTDDSIIVFSYSNVIYLLCSLLHLLTELCEICLDSTLCEKAHISVP